MENKESAANESGKRLVDLVRGYVSMTDEMANLIEKAFGANSEDIRRVVAETKESGKNVVECVDRYVSAVNKGLDDLDKAFGMVK